MALPMSLTVWQTTTDVETVLEETLQERLDQYNMENGKLPDRIIIFRIGFTKDLVHQVLTDESFRIDPCIDPDFDFDDSYEDYNPKITIILCQHGESTGAHESQEAANDIESGTLVRGNDFYEHSQALQGQGRANYAIILDKSDFNVGELQVAIKTLSNLWENSSRGSNMVAPAYCALQAARHATAFLDSAKTAAEKGAIFERLVEDSEKGFVDDVLQETAYYM